MTGPTFRALDQDAEASHITVQAATGVVFLRLRRDVGGKVARRMFVELTIPEALATLKELSNCIRVAMAAQARAAIR